MAQSSPAQDFHKHHEQIPTEPIMHETSDRTTKPETNGQSELPSPTRKTKPRWTADVLDSNAKSQMANNPRWLDQKGKLTYYCPGELDPVFSSFAPDHIFDGTKLRGLPQPKESTLDEYGIDRSPEAIDKFYAKALQKKQQFEKQKMQNVNSTPGGSLHSRS